MDPDEAERAVRLYELEHELQLEPWQRQVLNFVAQGHRVHLHSGRSAERRQFNEQVFAFEAWLERQRDEG